MGRTTKVLTFYFIRGFPATFSMRLDKRQVGKERNSGKPATVIKCLLKCLMNVVNFKGLVTFIVY